MNYKIVNTFPHAFFEDAKAPLISIYQDTSRYSTDNKHDALTFKNLVNSIETSLLEKYDKSSVKPVIELLRKIQDDRKFWQHCLDGMALFSNLDECIIYDLKKSPETVAVVSDSFHIKPLIQYFQFVNTYQILDLDKASFQIFEGDAYSLKKIELSEDVETTIEEILGRYSEPSYHTHGTYGGASDTSTFHGHGGTKAADEIDLERFLRRVDTIVYDALSKVSKKPLLLLAPKAYHSRFFEISDNTYLEPIGISGTYETLKDEGLKKEIETYDRKIFSDKMKVLIDTYHHLKSNDRASDDLLQIISAAVDGRIETLLLEDNKTISGKIDRQNKKLLKSEAHALNVDDILDDLSQITLEMGGQVYILDSEAMPSKTGVAAIFRY